MIWEYYLFCGIMGIVLSHGILATIAFSSLMQWCLLSFL